MGFKFSENTIGGIKYLYHDLTEAPAQPDHKNIIRKNALHIVPYSHQSPDGFEIACYELGDVHHGLISLVHVFHQKRPIKMEELILLMHGVVSTVISGVKLGLYENSFVLDPRYIYMKRNSTQPQLIYLPMKREEPLKVGFSELLRYLSGAFDDHNPLTKQILIALKNVAVGDFNYQDIATIVVQAANNKAVDEKYLKKPDAPKPVPQAADVSKKEEQRASFFRRLLNNVTGKEEIAGYDDPFADFDERTMINLTEASSIDLNVAALYVMEGNTRVSQILITKDAFVLGRKPEEVDYCFSGESDKGISRVHASIIFDGNGYFLTDKGSSGGTYLNGKRLAPGQPSKIKDGDTISLYTKKLLFECGAENE